MHVCTYVHTYVSNSPLHFSSTWLGNMSSSFSSIGIFVIKCNLWPELVSIISAQQHEPVLFPLLQSSINLNALNLFAFPLFPPSPFSCLPFVFIASLQRQQLPLFYNHTVPRLIFADHSTSACSASNNNNDNNSCHLWGSLIVYVWYNVCSAV